MTTDSAAATQRRRRITYYAAVVVGIGLAVVGLGELMALAVIGWLDAATLDSMYAGAAMHRMHVLAQAVIAWLIAIGILIQPLRRPSTFAAAVAALLALVAYTGAAAISGVFDPLAVIGVAALGMIVWAHPGRSTAQVLPVDRRMLMLGAPLVVGSIVLAAQQLVMQLSAGSGDPHAAIGHYGFTSAMAAGLGGAALIGSTSLPGRMLAAWLAVGGTAYFGLASIVFPVEASSLGTVGGAAAVAAAAPYAFGMVTAGKATLPAHPEPRPEPLG